jgi:hypothetical protein
MEDVWKGSLLADHFDSSDDDEDVAGTGKKGGMYAPAINLASARKIVTLKRLFVDSRNRDRAAYPSANAFRALLSVPLKNIRSLSLTDAKIPIIAGHMYVVVVVRNVRDKTLINSRESAGMPTGALAVIPLRPAFPGATYAYYRSQPAQGQGGSGTGWKLVMPHGMPQLVDVHMQIYGWGWNGVTGQPETIPYPIAADPALPATPIDDRNVYFQIEIEHLVQ